MSQPEQPLHQTEYKLVAITCMNVYNIQYNSHEGELPVYNIVGSNTGGRIQRSRMRSADSAGGVLLYGFSANFLAVVMFIPNDYRKVAKNNRQKFMTQQRKKWAYS